LNFINTKFGRIVLNEIPTFFVRKIDLIRKREQAISYSVLEQEVLEELSVRNKIQTGDKQFLPCNDNDRLIEKIEIVSKDFKIDEEGNITASFVERIFYQDGSNSIYSTFGIFTNRIYLDKNKTKSQQTQVKTIHNKKNVI